MLNTAPSATASLLLDLYQSLRRLQLVGPADLVELGLAPNTPLDKRQLDLLAEIRGRDAIVIEVGEYWLPRIGFGFVRDLLRAYDALDAAAAD